MTIHTGNLGDPDIEIARLKIWIHGLAYPGSPHASDRDWLRATVDCTTDGARVTMSGTFIGLRSLSRFSNQLDSLYRALEGNACLEPREPNLKVTMTGDGLGGIEAVVEITPDQLSQRHEFLFSTDQTQLPEIRRRVAAVVDRHAGPESSELG